MNRFLPASPPLCWGYGTSAPPLRHGQTRRAGPARILGELAPAVGFHSSVAVLPITVAALATTPWIARHLMIPGDIERIILPGLCSGDLGAIGAPPGVAVERGPSDICDLPDFFHRPKASPTSYGAFDIEIIAEINHAPRLPLADILAQAKALKADGADVIDVGCDPGEAWSGVRDCVRALRDDGHRVSIDSFNPVEAAAAVAGGAELVLSVNGSNVERAARLGLRGRRCARRFADARRAGSDSREAGRREGSLSTRSGD